MLNVKNNKGVVKPLGVWNEEELYSRFKTLGAKRYMTECDGVISLTVSGLNKKKAVPYLQATFGEEIFEAFDEDMYIPPEYTGKMIHTYIDYEQSGVLVDYYGESYNFYERSGTHLDNTHYDLSLSSKYKRFLLGIKENLR